MLRFRIPRVVGTEARREHRVTKSHVASRIAHRLETRPVLPEKLPPVREQAVALAPFQIGEANRLHPWLLAQPLLQAERLHPLSSWRMRTLRLAESSPWWPSTSAGWPEEGI